MTIKRLIGSAPSQVSRNRDLSPLAFQDPQGVTLGNINQDTQVSDVKPSLLLDFANGKKLDPRITFTRASTASYYDGETTAVAEQNLLTYSDQIDNVIWSKNNLTVSSINNIFSPDGNPTVETVTASANTSFHEFSQNITVLPNTVYTGSIYVKANTHNYIYMFLQAKTSGTYISNPGYKNFDILSGVGFSGAFDLGSYLITSVGNGWYRISITATTPSNANQLALGIGLTNSSGIGNITLAGTESIYVYGAQLEQRGTLTSYTPTTSAPITNYIPVQLTSSLNSPRFDHDPITGESKGLFIEEQKTNVLSYSSTFDLWSKSSGGGTSASVASNTCIAPDGTLTGTLVVNPVGDQSIYTNTAVAAATVYTLSAYLKAATAGSIIRFRDSADNHSIDIDTSTWMAINPQSVTSYQVTPVGNGWYRCSMTFTTTGTTISFNPRVYNYAGSFYIWGAQLETGSVASSYIPTPITFTTRGSKATYKAASGLIRTAEANTVRYEPSTTGSSNLLVEAAASNLLKDSSTTGGFWSVDGGGNISQSRNATTAPDGTVSAGLYVRKDIGGTFGNWAQVSISSVVTAGFASSNTLTGSIWIKSATNSTVTGSIAISDVNYVTRTQSFNATNVWQRFTFTVAAGVYNAAGTNIGLGINLPNNSSVYIWGAQLETGSVATSYIPSVETFTGRTSVGTFFDSAGYIRSSAAGLARYTYNPYILDAQPKLLLEAAATNIIANTNTTSFQSTISTGTAVAPDGSTAYKVVPTAGAVNYPSRGSESSQSVSVSLTAGQYKVYSFSGYFASQGPLNYKPYLVLDAYTLSGSTNHSYAVAMFDTLTGTFSNVAYNADWTEVTAPTAIKHPCGMWYVTWTARYTQAATIRNTIAHYFQIYNQSNTATYTADGSSGVQYACMQLEEGHAPSSYIPTLTTSASRAADTQTSAAQSRAADSYSSPAVTRSADIAVMTGTNFSTWYRPDQSSLVVEFKTDINESASSDRVLYAFTNSGGNPTIASRISFDNGATRGTYRTFYRDISGTFPYAIDYNIYGGGYYSKQALAWSGVNDFSTTNDGNAIVTDTTGTFIATNMNQFTIGSGLGGSTYINGYIKRIAYYPKRLNNDELKELTS